MSILKKDYTLAITGCFDISKVTLFSNDQFLESIKIYGHQSSRILVPEILKLLQSYSLNVKDISRLIVDVGPGAFTSLRILVVTANALAYGLGIKIIPINSLEQLIEENVSESDPQEILVAMINAYSGQVYTSIYDNVSKKYLLQDACLKVDDLINSHIKALPKETAITFCGNGSVLHLDKIVAANIKSPYKFSQTVEADIVKIMQRMKMQNLDDLEELAKKQAQPLYIKTGFGPH